MINVHFYCSLHGGNFDPTPFLDHAQFEFLDYYRVGDVLQRGRFKGEISNYGYICLKSKQKGFDEFVHDLYAIKPLIVKSVADRKILHLTLEYKGQCNWEFKPILLQIISKLGLTLTLSCYELEDKQ